jgi:hypothetical protein
MQIKGEAMPRFTIEDCAQRRSHVAFLALVASAAIFLFAAAASGQAANDNTAAPRAASQVANQDQTKLPPVNTTVVVHGEVKDDYLPETVTIGTLDGETLQQAALSATVVTRDLLNDQMARVLTDVV